MTTTAGRGCPLQSLGMERYMGISKPSIETLIMVSSVLAVITCCCGVPTPFPSSLLQLDNRMIAMGSNTNIVFLFIEIIFSMLSLLIGTRTI